MSENIEVVGYQNYIKIGNKENKPKPKSSPVKAVIYVRVAARLRSL